MTPEIDSKLPGTGTTIFTVMSKLADDSGAINLSQGFPSFSPPAALLERVAHHFAQGNNQYAPMPGVAALREAIAAKTQTIQGRQVDADTEITVTSGATEGLFSSIQALVRRGDEVIVFDPAYDLYEPAVTLAGGKTVHVPLSLASDGLTFAVDWQGLRNAICDRTRLVICNFPNNPTGVVLDGDDLDTLAAILRGTDTLLLSDEVYEHIVFDGKQHRSLLSHDELWPRSVVVSSFGKTFHATGWKVGYCIAPAQISDEIRRIHQFTVFTVVTPIQQALAEFLEEQPEFYLELSQFYQHKRDYFCALLEKTGFRLVPTASTFFQVVDYSAICSEADVALAKAWTRDFGVASIPMSEFYAGDAPGRLLRFCFAKDEATLAAAVERLAEL